MIAWNILPIEASGIPGAGYLGMTMLPGRALFFACGAGQEIVLCARLKEAGSRAFRTGRNLQIEYRRYPAHGPERGLSPLLEALAARILGREADLASRLGAGEEGEPAAPLRQHLADSTVQRWQEGDVLCLELPADGRQDALRVKVGPRGRFPLDLFHWSASVADGAGRPAVSLAPPVQAFLLELFGRRLYDLPAPGTPRQEPIGTGQGRHLYFDLGRPVANDVPLQDSRSLDGGRLTLCFDVPTICDNRCLFCAATGDESERVVRAQAGVMAELERILGHLRPVMQAAGRVDISLTGRDALAMPGIETLVRRLRDEPFVGRLTSVTPGGRLTEEQLADRLREAGLDSVVLTLLGPDAATHDRVAGRKGAYRDLLASIRNLKAEGLGWELNIVVVRQNIRCLARIISRAESLGAAVRIYHFLSEPEIPTGLVRRCLPRYATLARALDCNRRLVEKAVSSIHYVPLCVLPAWARSLAGDSSRQSPEPPDSPPTACAACPEYLCRCPSVGRRYLEIHT
ncbi:MAG: radical SAM protein, partial [Deltaproteobacteria bacterium]|nr:radical SAM protein [Deltaproteobacteria bacterium]